MAPSWDVRRAIIERLSAARVSASASSSAWPSSHQPRAAGAAIVLTAPTGMGAARLTARPGRSRTHQLATSVEE